jgi:hypothetical protein
LGIQKCAPPAKNPHGAEKARPDGKNHRADDKKRHTDGKKPARIAKSAHGEEKAPHGRQKTRTDGKKHRTDDKKPARNGKSPHGEKKASPEEENHGLGTVMSRRLTASTYRPFLKAGSFFAFPNTRAPERRYPLAPRIRDKKSRIA